METCGLGKAHQTDKRRARRDCSASLQCSQEICAPYPLAEPRKGNIGQLGITAKAEPQAQRINMDTIEYQPKPEDPIRSYLSAIGRKGGSANTEKQNEARKANSKKGGWPKGRPRKVKP